MLPIEAATHHLPSLPRLRPARSAAEELEAMRPRGLAYLRRRYGKTMSHADMEDIVSEVVIRVHRKLEGGERPRNLQALFLASLHNAGVDQLRRQHAKPAVGLELAEDEPAPERTPLEFAEGSERSAILGETLQRMRPNYREAIMLRYGLGMTVPEIAEARGTTLPAAKKLVRRATEQARRRLGEVEREGFCEEMRDSARRAVIGRELAGVAEPAERRLLHAHLEHCGACRHHLASLRASFHELGGAAALAGLGAPHAQLGERLAPLAETLVGAPHALIEKTRVLAYRASGAFGSGEAASAGALGGTVQKVAAVCGAATASAATCLATGVIGPGIGGELNSHADHPPPAPSPITRQVESEPAPAEEPQAEPTAEPEPQPSASTEPTTEQTPAPEPEPTPAEQGGEEFGFESSAPPESAPPPQPAPAPSPPPEASGGGGGGGGSESFGFGG